MSPAGPPARPQVNCQSEGSLPGRSSSLEAGPEVQGEASALHAFSGLRVTVRPLTVPGPQPSEAPLPASLMSPLLLNQQRLHVDHMSLPLSVINGIGTLTHQFLPTVYSNTVVLLLVTLSLLSIAPPPRAGWPRCDELPATTIITASTSARTVYFTAPHAPRQILVRVGIPLRPHTVAVGPDQRQARSWTGTHVADSEHCAHVRCACVQATVWPRLSLRLGSESPRSGGRRCIRTGQFRGK
eukprot:475824-Rhodomonas_salina.1